MHGAKRIESNRAWQGASLWSLSRVAVAEATRPQELIIGDDDDGDTEEEANRRLSGAGSVIVHSNASDSPLVSHQKQQ